MTCAVRDVHLGLWRGRRGLVSDQDRDVCHVPESVRRTSGTARRGQGLAGPADRAEGRRRSWTIVWPEGTVHDEADRFLRRHDGSGTQKTYAYYLRWLEHECLAFAAVQLRDLERYMSLVGAEVRMQLGEPWRPNRSLASLYLWRSLDNEPA